MDANPPRGSSWPIAGAIALAGIIIAAAIRLPAPARSSTPTSTGTPPPRVLSAAGQPRADIDLEDDPSLGDPSAPIVMVEFSDFECSFCSRFWEETLPEIKKAYIDTGKVRFVYKDFPIASIHANAQKAAEAGECADDQGKFWELHDVIFANREAMTVPDLKRYAADLGLDMGKFNTCLDGGTHAAEVQADLAAGEKAGVQGTPAFFLNGIPISGAQPYATFQTLITEELQRLGKS